MSSTARQRFTLRKAVATAAPRWSARRIWKQYSTLAGLFEVLRQHGADSSPHAPERRHRPSSSARKANRSPTISRRSTTTSATISPTPSWAWNPARPRPRSAAAWKIGTRATTASWILQGLPPQARHRLARPPLHPARARFPLHL